jgi:16S rRNA (guanine527-N7)-methyltransferase
MTISGLTAKYSKDFGIMIDDTQQNLFDKYAKLLVEWNEKINLTAILDDEGIAIKHFTDSLTILKYFPKSDFSLIDVGTGAGFPSVPIKIMRNDAKITLLDSLNKRITFLGEVSKELNLDFEMIHGRAEDFGRNPDYREKYDFATARAVTNLPALLEYTLPFIKVGGKLIAMKGKDADAEIEQSQNALLELGGEIEAVDSLILPDNSERNIIIVKKISQLSAKYPRTATKINKKPL